MKKQAVLGGIAALLLSACSQGDTQNEPVLLVQQDISSSRSTAEWELDQLSDWVSQNLPRWTIYTTGDGKYRTNRPNEWDYTSRPHDLDTTAATIAVPFGKENDPSTWVRFSASRYVAERDNYLNSLLDKISILDLITISVAIRLGPDDLPILPESVGSAMGRLEDDPGNPQPSFPPDWDYGPRLPGRGGDQGGQVTPPQQPPTSPGRAQSWSFLPRPPEPTQRAPEVKPAPGVFPTPNMAPAKQWDLPLWDFNAKQIGLASDAKPASWLTRLEDFLEHFWDVEEAAFAAVVLAADRTVFPVCHAKVKIKGAKKDTIGLDSVHEIWKCCATATGWPRGYDSLTPAEC